MGDEQAAAVAVLARHPERLEQARTDPLTGHLYEAERGDLGHLVLGAVTRQALEQPAQHEIAVALEHHVDEVDDDDAADVAQPQLADDLLGRLEVVLGDGLLEVAALAGELAGVDVDDLMASVRSMTSEPPLGSQTLRSSALASCSSMR